jgi:hypothetical protein
MKNPTMNINLENDFEMSPAMLWDVLSSLRKTVEYVLTGRLHFIKQRLGQVVTADNARDYTIFREIIVDRRSDQPEKPKAVFVLNFQVTNLSPKQNQFLSLLPIPLYVGFPGFRSKVYTINQSYCQSIYEFDTAQDAENYSQSAALKFITRRSVPGSVSYKTISNQTP